MQPRIKTFLFERYFDLRNPLQPVEIGFPLEQIVDASSVKKKLLIGARHEKNLLHFSEDPIEFTAEEIQFILKTLLHIPKPTTTQWEAMQEIKELLSVNTEK